MSLLVSDMGFLLAQNIVLGLAAVSGTGWITSQGSTILRFSSWKISTWRRLAPPATAKMTAGGPFDRAVLFVWVIRDKRPMRLLVPLLEDWRSCSAAVFLFFRRRDRWR